MRSKSDIREELISLIKRELLGPHEETEEIEDLPDEKYILGVLYPSYSEVEEVVGDEIPEEEDAEAKGPSSPSEMKPSFRQASMGLTFTLSKSSQSFKLKIEWAIYDQPERNGNFIRRPLDVDKEISVDDLERGDLRINIYEGIEIEDIERREHYLVVRRHPSKKDDGPIVISVFLWNNDHVEVERGDGGKRTIMVNGEPLEGTEPERKPRAVINSRCIFQPKIHVLSPEGNITTPPTKTFRGNDKELSSLELLYRERHEFATGHGCSVQWVDEDGERCSKLETTFIPSFEQHPTVYEVEGLKLDMGILADPEREGEARRHLDKLISEYERWIEGTLSISARSSLEERFQEIAERHEREARSCLERMKKGIEIIFNDKYVLKAFQWMNEALYLQRAKKESEPSWRPFQMAFILMTIPDIVQKNLSEYHKDVDLLWIPTGGGKTEAYLGLASFTMFYRRLTGNPPYNLGASVIMRYTLRLLTLQQFQRAASLMCAMEIIRGRESESLGEEPFRVGLYVGGSTTPNKIDGEKGSATWSLDQWRRNGKKPEDSNPFQLNSCPWCSHDLGEGSYTIDREKKSLTARCLNPDCPFSALDIPVLTVDEDIYHRLPALLIATVDKFANIPFNPGIGMLFGHVQGRCSTHGFIPFREKHSSTHRDGGSFERFDENDVLDPPDLIIQDELHLINGPLGSLVGIYESTLEQLCKRKNDGDWSSPKYIASTATIRNSAQQVWQLYGKDIRRFPPSSITYSDSFFTREESDTERSKVYLGIRPSGIGQRTALKRAVAQALVHVDGLRDDGVDPSLWDDYWTVVLYFNTLKELGATRTTVEDDIHNLVKTHGSDRGLELQELNSSVSSRDLPEILKRLDTPAGRDVAIDVLLSTNMFSVGVDVQRLGLMIVNSQPKTTSEYLQATGRVGRRGTGLVLVVYSWNRPRDQSHFERFFDYHNRIQLHVESMTVTPFSKGSRDRALHAQVTALMRTLSQDPNFVVNSGASLFDSRMRREKEGLVGTLIERIRRCSSDRAIPEGARREIERFLDEWVEAAEDETESLNYSPTRYRGDRNLLMVRSIREMEDEGLTGPKRLTQTSMRNVEETIPFHTIRGLKEII